MNILVDRVKADDNETLGIMYIDGAFECFTMEDVVRKKKIKGITAIPTGKYEVKLRNEGGLTQKYAERFPKIHKGMLWLQNVKNFKWVYIHVGNNATDTEGCILVGDGCVAVRNALTVSNSRHAYERVYKIISEAIIDGEDVTIEVM